MAGPRPGLSLKAGRRQRLGWTPTRAPRSGSLLDCPEPPPPPPPPPPLRGEGQSAERRRARPAQVPPPAGDARAAQLLAGAAGQGAGPWRVVVAVVGTLGPGREAGGSGSATHGPSPARRSPPPFSPSPADPGRLRAAVGARRLEGRGLLSPIPAHHVVAERLPFAGRPGGAGEGARTAPRKCRPWEFRLHNPPDSCTPDTVGPSS